MNKTLVLTTLLIALMTLTTLPAQGFHHPSTTDDLNYETFGPRADQVLIKIYGSYAVEYLAFQAQQIDLMDWPLAAGDYNWLEANDPTHETYNSVSYTDFGTWEVDINNQQYPTDVLSFRKALSYMIDKQYFIGGNINIGLTVAVKADSPTAHLSAWYNPYCDDLYNLAPRTTVAPFPDDLADFVAAYNLLVDDLGPPVTDPEDPSYFTWLWPAKPEDPHGYVNLPNHLLVFARNDPNRAKLGAFIQNTLEADMPAALVAAGLPRARINVDLYTVPSSECRREVMCEYRYHLYTGGWALTRDPDNLAYCYGADQVWKPNPYAPNYPCYNNPLFDQAWDDAEAQPDAASAVPYVYECQKIMMDDAAIIPIWLTAGYKAYLSEWDGVVNMAGRGPHNFWTLMNARLRSGTGEGDTLRYGFVNDVAFLNPVHASWVWDRYVMENIYDSLISYNPYNVAEDIPWMAWWEIGTWDGGAKTKLTFHLRTDIVWQDVPAKADRTYDILPAGATGVPVTTKDVAFTVISIRDNLDAWNQFLVADVAKVEINDAVLGVAGNQMKRPYDNELMDVYGLSSVPTQDVIVYYNILSPWITLHWVGGLPIMPYHIWYWVPWWDYDGDGTIDTWLFDPEIEDALYGSGPYIFDHRTPGIEILLKAFKAGTAYHGITSTGEYMKLVPTLYVQPTVFRKLQGASFSLNVTVDDVVDLYAFDISLYYNTTLLDALSVAEGAFLKEGGATYLIRSEVNDTAGQVRLAVSLLGAPHGVSGTGTLFTIQFKSSTAATGPSPLNLTNTDLSNYYAQPINHTITNGQVTIHLVEELTHTVVVGGVSYNFTTTSSSSVTNFAYDDTEKFVSFDATGPLDIPGFTNITIPKALLALPTSDTFVVLFDTETIYYTRTENATHYFLYFTYSHTSHKIEIKRTLIGDFNGNRRIDIGDVGFVGAAYDATPADARWNPLADLAAPWNKIDIYDIVMVTRIYDKTWTP